MGKFYDNMILEIMNVFVCRGMIWYTFCPLNTPIDGIY